MFTSTLGLFLTQGKASFWVLWKAVGAPRCWLTNTSLSENKQDSGPVPGHPQPATRPASRSHSHSLLVCLWPSRPDLISSLTTALAVTPTGPGPRAGILRLRGFSPMARGKRVCFKRKTFKKTQVLNLVSLVLFILL